jgi:hypothetical protein
MLARRVMRLAAFYAAGRLELEPWMVKLGKDILS